MDSVQKNNQAKWRVGFLGAFIGVIALFFIFPLFSTSPYVHVPLQFVFVLLIFSIIYSLSDNRPILISGIILIALFIFLDSLSHYLKSLPLLTFAFSIYSLFMLLAITILAKRIFWAHVVNTNLIFGALTVYLLSGILWGKAYFIIAYLFPGSFKGTGVFDLSQLTFHDSYEMQFNLLYYSFVTLATLGLGDITPTLHLAKSLTVLEAVTGQLFVATVIAKLVSVWRN